MIIKTTTRKIFEKNPLKYPVVRLSRYLDPSKMGSDEDEVAKTFSLLLADLINKRLITESEGDAALLQMKLFIQEMRLNSSAFEQFDKKSQRLDAFFSTHLTGVQKFCDLFKVIKFVLILTHGQASVERGFSVNKKIIVENLKSESLVARRLVYDELQDKAVHDIIITKEMLASSRAARMRYHNYLEEEKKKKVNEETRLKRKQMEDSLNDLKNKKMKIEKSMSIMLKEADEMCLKAEKQSIFSLLAKSNAYRKKAAESAEEVRNITKEIEKISSAK